RTDAAQERVGASFGPRRADRDVGEAVEVAVGKRCDSASEQRAHDAWGEREGRSGQQKWRPTPIEVEAALVGGPAVEARGADREISEAVAVDVPPTRDRPAHALKGLDATVLPERVVRRRTAERSSIDEDGAPPAVGPRRADAE